MVELCEVWLAVPTFPLPSRGGIYIYMYIYKGMDGFSGNPQGFPLIRECSGDRKLDPLPVGREWRGLWFPRGGMGEHLIAPGE